MALRSTAKNKERQILMKNNIESMNPSQLLNMKEIILFLTKVAN